MTTLLVFHIITAILTLALSVFSWIRPTHILLIPLTMSSLVSIITGIMVSQSSSLLATCTKLGIYLFIIVLSALKLNGSIFSTRNNQH